MQTTSHLLMIRPVNFGFNAETAVNNSFQQNSTAADTNEKAVKEFDEFVALLQGHGVDVTVVEDTPDPHTPDSIFPNNWISFHDSGRVLLYPMFAQNRRLERKDHVVRAVRDKFTVNETIDLSGYEAKNIFLEGTGSMVLDRDNRITYACLSPRTDLEALDEFCRVLDYKKLVFHASDAEDRPIYHTNVMMCVADRYVVICLDSVRDAQEKQSLLESFANTEKDVITISIDQMNHFAGNMLQVENNSGEKFLVMSTQAWNSLTGAQQETLSEINRVLHASLQTIETNGGGSARCMMAEVHLSRKN